MKFHRSLTKMLWDQKIMDKQTDGQRENSIAPANTVSGGVITNRHNTKKTYCYKFTE